MSKSNQDEKKSVKSLSELGQLVDYQLAGEDQHAETPAEGTTNPQPARPAPKQTGPEVDPDTGLPIVREGEAQTEKKRAQEMGELLFKNRDFLRKTEDRQDDPTWGKPRVDAKKGIKRLREQAKSEGISWERVEGSAVVASVYGVENPSEDNHMYVRRVIENIRHDLVSTPRLRRTAEGKPEIPYFREPDRQDMQVLKRFQSRKPSKEHPFQGDGKVLGVRILGRWIVANNDPLMKTRTGTQNAIGHALRDMLARVEPRLARFERQEVAAEQMAGVRTDLSELASEMPGIYECRTGDGRGAVYVELGDHTPYSKPGEKQKDPFRVVRLVGATGRLAYFADGEVLKEGFWLPLDKVVPREGFRGGRVTPAIREQGGEYFERAKLLSNTICVAIERAQKAAAESEKQPEAEEGGNTTSIDEQIAEEM